MRRRRLWIIVVVLISWLGALFLTTATPVNELLLNATRWEHVNRTCRARDCNETVNYEQLHSIESYMNTTADPCESFFSYACGNWHNRHPHGTTMMMKGNDQLLARFVELFESWLIQRNLEKQEGVSELKERRTLAEQNELPEEKQLAEILEISNDYIEELPRFLHEKTEQTEAKETVETLPNWHAFDDPVLRKLLKYYRICKTQNTLNQQNLRAYYEITKSSVNWQLNGYDWLGTLAELGRFGYSAHFINMRVVVVNISIHRIVITPHESMSTLKINSEMFAVLSDFTNQTQTELQQRFDALENELEKLNCQYCDSSAEEEDDIGECDCYRNETMTFGNLTKQLPEINWQRYLSQQLGRPLNNDDIIEIANRDLIRKQLAYVQQLDMELNLLYTLARFLSFIQEQRQHFAEHKSIELSCIHHMRKIMNLPMNYLYEKAYYSSKRVESQRIIEEIFEELKVQFEKMIKQNDMEFSQFVQQKLLTKLKHININVGNLPKNVSMQFYCDYIAAYNFTDDFTYNHLHALKVFYKHYNALLDATEHELQHTWHTFDLHHPFYFDSLDASPYYSARTNLIVITYAYLQLPFYDQSFWPVFIYGDLASTLGHELIHAFDTNFLQFDENGNPSVQPFASMKLNSNFNRNNACLQRGTVFQSERMADISGARLALNTFLSLDQNVLEHNGKLYFLQFSQFFCSTENQAELNHDAENLRLDYVCGALPEFSRVFNCPLGSPMNQSEKCEMYT